ncbi:MAG: SAM-dependent methyltransferase [Eggerthella lenta]
MRAIWPRAEAGCSCVSRAATRSCSGAAAKRRSRSPRRGSLARSCRVTSGVAAPAFAGIPVTHRGLASSVTFVTGSEDPTKAETAVDWSGIAHGADTLCFYMGVRNLPVIARRLMEAGRSADTPVSLVRWGTTPMQEVLAGTLATIAERAAAVGFKAPAIIVVGAVAALRERLAWYEPGPLAGTTVAVTRTRAQASGLTERLRALGASVIELPVISIAAPSVQRRRLVHRTPRRLPVRRVHERERSEGVFERLVLAGLDARALACARIAAIEAPRRLSWPSAGSSPTSCPASSAEAVATCSSRRA